MHYPCSWYLENNKVIPYEYNQTKIDHDIEQIKSHLKILEEKGYQQYGVTVRPILNKVEVETKGGHKYYDRENFKMDPTWKESETAIDGRMVDGCYAYYTCVITFMQAHVKDYGHDVQ